MFRGSALSLFEIEKVMRGVVPHGRKIALNFAVAGYIIDARLLADLFPPEHYLCKLTPMHRTATAEKNNIRTDDGYCSYYPYREHEEALKAAGYDVIVFLPSIEEDLGRITCGNAILAGTLPEVEYAEIQ
jgi:23S rRNA (adenine2503-C2)-methyltransferase